MACFWRIIIRDVVISIITAVVVELVLDQWRKPKAQIQFNREHDKKKENNEAPAIS